MDMYGFGEPDLLERLFPVFFIVIFALIVLTFLFLFGRALIMGMRNRNAPRLSVTAKVVSRRGHMSRSSGSGYTSYYVTFEVESGDRMELRMDGESYGLLAEGDVGILRFQGSRYLGFDRAQSASL